MADEGGKGDGGDSDEEEGSGGVSVQVYLARSDVNPNSNRTVKLW